MPTEPLELILERAAAATAETRPPHNGGRRKRIATVPDEATVAIRAYRQLIDRAGRDWHLARQPAVVDG